MLFTIFPKCCRSFLGTATKISMRTAILIPTRCRTAGADVHSSVPISDDHELIHPRIFVCFKKILNVITLSKFAEGRSHPCASCWSFDGVDASRGLLYNRRTSYKPPFPIWKCVRNVFPVVLSYCTNLVRSFCNSNLYHCTNHSSPHHSSVACGKQSGEQLIRYF